ncbi:MAG: hypothetical protein HYZ61_01790 [Candidatus Andersenbacteria bacterium]|nr:hypothetical protein [Candidatus Andersenbacteria bacterium]
MNTESKLKEISRAKRMPEVPIIVPRDGDKYWWEKNGVFNPGVTEYKGNILLLYRAYDDFRISRLGMAHSEDGVKFTQYDHPAIDTDPDDADERLGIEDPRITKIDDTYYIIHTVSSYHRVGEKPEVRGVMDYLPWRIRVAMHTTKDFHSYNHWDVILPNIPAKNASLLPEKINDQFGLYYREFTDEGETLKLAYTKDFKSWSEALVIPWPKPQVWQGFKFGTGSQPISTSKGFLMVYHAVDNNQVYRLGLIMFDRQDPTKILWYTGPILEPETTYEKEGYVQNVVYTCGAIIRDNELWIYYGAADKVIGRAVLSLSGII